MENPTSKNESIATKGFNGKAQIIEKIKQEIHNNGGLLSEDKQIDDKCEPFDSNNITPGTSFIWAD